MKLSDLKDDSKFNTRAQKQKRGFDFENYLFDTFEAQEFKVRRPFKKLGEQIDGGIYIDGNWYLIEAKWHSKEIPASAVYSFRGKVDGKLAGTKGFFISWSGYSNECADALRLGKEINIILCDSTDVEQAEIKGWIEIFREKLMFAALFGEVYLTKLLFEAYTSQKEKTFDIEFFVEGQNDENILRSILKKLEPNINYSVMPCSGKISAIKMAGTFPKGKDSKRILIIDSDGNPNIVEELSGLPYVDQVISIDPEIEALFYPVSEDPRRDFRFNSRSSSQTYSQHIEYLLPEILKNDPQGFISKIKGILGNK